MSYTFCPFKEEHLQQAALIENYTFDAWNLQQIREELQADAAHLFAAIDNENGAVIAFCAFQCAANEASLNAVTCLPVYREQGVATALLKYAFSILNAKNVYLEVRLQNTPAIKLYKSLGFSEAGLRKNFYKAPIDDAIVMSLELI